MGNITIIFIFFLAAKSGPDAGMEDVCKTDLANEFLKNLYPITERLVDVVGKLNNAKSLKEADKAFAEYLKELERYCYGWGINISDTCLSSITDKCGNDYCDRYLDKITAIFNANSCVMSEPPNPMGIPDYRHLLDVFRYSISTSMREYLVNEFIDNQEVIADEGYLGVTWNQLSEYVARWGQFSSGNKGFVLNNEAEWKYKNYLANFLRGYSQDPIFGVECSECEDECSNRGNAKVDELYPEIKMSYERYIRKYPNTRSGKIVKAFYGMLKNHGFMNGRYVEEFYKKYEINEPDWWRRWEGEEKDCNQHYGCQSGLKEDIHE